MEGLLAEVVAVAKAQGIIWIKRSAGRRSRACSSRRSARAPPCFRMSKRFDETEIDVVNGAIVEGGKRNSVATPLNDAMVWMVKSLQEYLAGTQQL